MSAAPPDRHPAPPPSAIVRAAQARLLDRLERSELDASARIPDERGDERSDECSDEDRYELGELLATGGLGLVRRAFDRRLGRLVAVKELQAAKNRASRQPSWCASCSKGQAS